MADKEYRLPALAASPMVTGYLPELNVTEVLDAETSNYYP
jgi:hypothetical protein